MKRTAFDPVSVALEEDIGEGDITTDAFVPASLRSTARIVAREKAIVAGTATAAEVFRRVDPSVHVEMFLPDGMEAAPDTPIMEVRGAARSILKAERVALNFMQRLCGIATLTRQYVDAAHNDHVKILDTRKTTPGLRKLEKAAVAAGGGANHRQGLYDMVLVKDNHLVATSGFSGFAKKIRQIRKEHPNLRIELEADNLDQVRAFVEMEGVDVILLDNMPPSQLREAVALRKSNIKFEASGGITLRNIQRIAATGVDYISVGALTHSARSIDLSLEMTHGVS